LTRRRCEITSRIGREIKSLMTARFRSHCRSKSRLLVLAGRSVLVATASQLTAAPDADRAGWARRPLEPPDIVLIIFQPYSPLKRSTRQWSIATPKIVDARRREATFCKFAVAPAEKPPPPNLQSEWLLLTSGTTCVPKLVAQTPAHLVAPLKSRALRMEPPYGPRLRHSPSRGLEISPCAVLGADSR
jgi:hypothetical protein